jgi:ATP synthase protein I
MMKAPSPRRLRDFDARLDRLRAETQGKEGKHGRGEPTTGVGMAFAIASHLVAGLMVGGGIGYLLDRWLETAPFLLITFFFLGAAGGGMNVYRQLKGYGLAVGYRPVEGLGKDKAAGSATQPADQESGEGRG